MQPKHERRDLTDKMLTLAMADDLTHQLLEGIIFVKSFHKQLNFSSLVLKKGHWKLVLVTSVLGGLQYIIQPPLDWTL